MLGCKSRTENLELALYYKDTVLAAMQELRAVGDEIEALIGEGYLPYPTYGQLLFGVYSPSDKKACALPKRTPFPCPEASTAYRLQAITYSSSPVSSSTRSA